MLFSLICRRSFSSSGMRVELARGREGPVDHRLRHPVAGQVEEADLLARVPHLAATASSPPGSPPERGPEVDDRDGPRRLLEASYCRRSEYIHCVP